MHEGQFRVIYIAKLADAVSVLHASRKKTQTPNIDAAKQALKQLKQRGMGNE